MKHQQYIGASIILGCTIGAAVGGKLMQYGRRLSHFVACAIGILGVSFTLLHSYEMQLVGRLIYGMAAGL